MWRRTLKRRARAVCRGGALVLVSLGTAGPAFADGPPPLAVPVACTMGETCLIQQYVDTDSGPSARDYRCRRLSYDGHDGTDIRVPTVSAMSRGVPVVAAAAGRVKAVRDGMPDAFKDQIGKDLLDGKQAGNGVVVDHGGGWETQYSHLRLGSIAVQPGQRVAAGDRLGLIGLSGNTEFPHLEFEVRHRGTSIDPFTGKAAGDGCGPGGKGLWRPEAAARLAYRGGGLLAAGFANRGVEARDIVGQRVKAMTLTPGADAVVFYALTYGLQPGDREVIALRTADGEVLARRQNDIGDHSAQRIRYIGKRTGGEAGGGYVGRYTVTRDTGDGREAIVEIERRIRVR